jgi:hypothetical protein
VKRPVSINDIDRIVGEAAKSVVLSGDLVVRASTAPPQVLQAVRAR